MDYFVETFQDKKKKIYMTIFDFGIVIMGIICLICQKNAGMIGGFLLGALFFFTGLFFGLLIKYGGIIFLFSHGGLGYVFMIQSLMGDIISEPMLTDGNTEKLKFYLYVIAVFTICGFGSAIIYNLSDKFKQKQYTVFLPISFLTIAFILAGILPFIVNKLV